LTNGGQLLCYHEGGESMAMVSIGPGVYAGALSRQIQENLSSRIAELNWASAASPTAGPAAAASLTVAPPESGLVSAASLAVPPASLGDVFVGKVSFQSSEDDCYPEGQGTGWPRPAR
jgi:hypothetical protein